MESTEFYFQILYNFEDNPCCNAQSKETKRKNIHFAYTTGRIPDSLGYRTEKTPEEGMMRENIPFL